MSNIVPYILLSIVLLFLVIFSVLHWRYHPQATPVESFADLQKSLRKGKLTLLQFHAPL